MADTPVNHKRAIPAAFDQYRRKMFERTVRLTEQAIAELEANGQTVTLSCICEVTRDLDEQDKGLRPTTILRNPQAAELFHQHSPAYHERQQKTQRAKRKPTKTQAHADARARYRGLRKSDLSRMVETLKACITELNAQQEKLRLERDDAYRLRDEALHQNTRLLAALAAQTRLLNPKR